MMRRGILSRSQRLADSNVDWEAWGHLDPVFGVSTTAVATRDRPSEMQAFFDSGRVEWESYFAHWEKYGVDLESCVEIGCGAGRLTLQLARTFHAVHAVDVSAAALEHAGRHVHAASVTFLPSDGLRLPLPDATVSAAFSAHVFQHFDSPDHALAYFADIARVLRPGGTLMVHMPVHRWPTMAGVFHGAYSLQKRVGNARAWMKRRLVQLGLSGPGKRYLSYSIDELFEKLPQLGLSDVEIWVFRPTAAHESHPFVLARKQ